MSFNPYVVADARTHQGRRRQQTGQGQSYINDKSQTQPHESYNGTWDPERQEYYDANSYTGSILHHWIWDPKRSEWYYLNSPDGTRVYNTLTWDPENRTYIRKNYDEHEDIHIQNASDQGRDAYDLASKAEKPLGGWRRTARRPPKVPEGDSSNTQSNVGTNPIWMNSATPPPDSNQDAGDGFNTPKPDTHELPHYLSSETTSSHNWRGIRSRLSFDWKWDIEYHTTNADYSGQHGSWTSTSMEPTEPKDYPLKIGNAPVVLPMEYQWPPVGGVTPPPDPRATAPIDCRADLPLTLVKDLFLTFEGSIGFYVLINGFLQVMVPVDYDTSWASSHLPHKYGGLKVCYIEQTLEPTMLPTRTETGKIIPRYHSPGSSSTAELSQTVHLSAQHSVNHPSLRLNDFIAARPLSNHRRERFSGRVGLRVINFGIPFVVMSTHVITEAIMARSHRDTILGRNSEERIQKLDGNWNDHIEIWAGNGKIGTIHETFDKEAGIYPDGFNHDVTLVKPASQVVVKDIVSPVADLGWLNHDSWTSLRQQTTTVKILADNEGLQLGKSIKCSRPSDVLVVGEGIFLNQKAAAGSSRDLKNHDASTWKDLVSRALLYRVYPDFDPPNGHSGTALYADGIREDGTEGPGIVGFQSFVQRSGHVQNFEMEGPALERRLQLGRVAFYGAFEVPEELKQYDIA